MNCQGVRALIDASPFEPGSPAQREAAERHLRDCAECRASRSAAKALDAELTALPEPQPPAELSAILQARIAQHAERKAVSGDAAPAASTESHRDRFAWAALLAGAVISLGALAYGYIAGGAAVRLTTPVFHQGTQALIEMRGAWPAAPVLAAGLLFYVAGLCVPRRSR